MSLVPELSVTDFEKSLAFYTTILGFRVDYQRIEEGFAFLSLGDAKIMIDTVGKGRILAVGKLEYPLGRGVNLQIEIAHVDSLLHTLKAHQISLFIDLEEKHYRKNGKYICQRQFWVRDPDGYLLRFVEKIDCFHATNMT